MLKMVVDIFGERGIKHFSKVIIREHNFVEFFFTASFIVMLFEESGEMFVGKCDDAFISLF